MIQTSSTQADFTCELISTFFMNSINTKKNQLKRVESKGKGSRWNLSKESTNHQKTPQEFSCLLSICPSKDSEHFKKFQGKTTKPK